MPTHHETGDTGGVAATVAGWLATGFGSGFSPLAPGTAGTIVAIPFACFMPAATGAQLAYLAVVIAAAIWSADVTARRLGIKDPGRIVADEIAGYLVAVAFLPITATTLVAAFVLFRLFDIAKPPPCRQFEALPGGVGIVADDLMAGVYSNLVIRALCALEILSL